MSFANWGAVFDWDGVIIDSSKHHEESWNRLAKEAGYTLAPGAFARSFGMKNNKAISEIFGWTTDPEKIQSLGKRKEVIYREVIQEWVVDPLPGVVPWLEALYQAGVPCVIGSSTDRLNITTTLDKLNLRYLFHEIASAEDVVNGKPSPDVFLCAAKKIGIDPKRCVVFEDAFVGLEAGKAAGMKLIGVATSHSPEKLAPYCDKVVKRLDELSLAELGSWFK